MAYTAELSQYMRLYGQNSAIHAVIRPDLRNLCGTYGQISAIYAAYMAGASAAYALIISPYKI